MTAGDETRIVLRRPGGSWRQPDVSSYTNEKGLQQILLETIVEPSGSITLIECKLAKNAEVKRAVVGQIMSYAAAAWRATYEELDQWFSQRAGSPLAVAVALVAEANGLPWDAEEFRASVVENLSAGRFRLFIVVDRITDELRGIVEYVNTHTTPELELLALELSYVADGDVEILMPQTHGEESARLKRGRYEPRQKWTIDDVLSAFAQLSGDAGLEVVRALRDDILARGGKVYPGKGQYPTMSAYISVGGNMRAPWAAYADPSGPTAPRISLNFGSLKKSLTDDTVEALLVELEGISALAPYLEDVRAKSFESYPSLPVSALGSPGVVQRFLAAMDSCLPSRSSSDK